MELSLALCGPPTGIHVCVELGQMGEAERLMGAMRARSLDPGWASWHMLIHGYARRGDMDAARRAFARLRESRHGEPIREEDPHGWLMSSADMHTTRVPGAA